MSARRRSASGIGRRALAWLAPCVVAACGGGAGVGARPAPPAAGAAPANVAAPSSASAPVTPPAEPAAAPASASRELVVPSGPAVEATREQRRSAVLSLLRGEQPGVVGIDADYVSEFHPPDVPVFDFDPELVEPAEPRVLPGNFVPAGAAPDQKAVMLAFRRSGARLASCFAERKPGEPDRWVVSVEVSVDAAGKVVDAPNVAGEKSPARRECLTELLRGIPLSPATAAAGYKLRFDLSVELGSREGSRRPR